MRVSAVEIEVPRAERVTVIQDTLSVDLNDGRTISVPLVWFPSVLHASPEERKNWRLIGKGQGIHWEDLDEDISVEGLLADKSSGEKSVIFPKMACRQKPSPNETLQPTLAARLISGVEVVEKPPREEHSQ